MYDMLNALLTQRQTMFQLAAEGNPDPCPLDERPRRGHQKAGRQPSRRIFEKVVKWVFHHKPVEPKDLGVRQIEATKGQYHGCLCAR